MKKKIPELLDYADEIVITDEIRDLFDPVEIKELTMKKIHESERQTARTRRPSAILLAAALAALLTATAFAAYQFLIAEQFDGYFGELSDQQAQVMEQIGTAELPACTANGTTITPLAVIGDDRHCYAKFHLEAPEGTCFPATEEELEALHIFGPTFEERYRIVDENGEALPIASSQIQWIDAAPGDNVLEFIVRFNSNIDYPAHFNDGTTKTLTIYGIWLEGMDKEYTPVLEGPWSFDIGFYGSIEERTPEVDGLDVRTLVNGAEYEEDGMSITLRSMSLSPLALTYAYDYTTSDPRVMPGPGTIQIVMKDGSAVEVVDGLGSFTDSYYFGEAILQAPVDLNEVDYIQFGSQQIGVN